MKEFKRKVQYYETDKMGITHHSNYIRMMEEARIDYFSSVDMPYDKLESIGIISPVIVINCKYRRATTFPDELKIYTKVLEYNSAKLVMNYIFKNDKDEVVFVEVASVQHRKAQDVAIKAFQIVKSAIPNASLYFVGVYHEESDYFQGLQKLIEELGLQGSIQFVGYDKNPFKWVKNADCFVFPSRAEGLPNALVEASYLGVPCAAARCLPIVDDIIRDGQNGYVVDVDDVEGMAQAMIKACAIEECKMIYRPGNAEDFAKVFESV